VPERPPEAARAPFAYAIVRVVPRVERGERLNAGIVLLCRPLRFLGAEIRLDVARLASLDPACDIDEVRAHLDLIRRIAAGDSSAGPIAALSQPERFHWLVAPSSTVIQPSAVHADPAATLEHLVRTLVGVAPAP